MISHAFEKHGRSMGSLFCLAALLLTASSPCWGQTRAAEIERQRDEKVARPMPEKSDKVEKTLRFIDDNKVIERLSVGYLGWNLRFGGLPPGSGFALGPEYRLHSDALGGNTLRVGAQFSTRQYQRYGIRWDFPRLADDHIAVDFTAAHRDYPQVDYFGPGPASSESTRTNYRLEDTSVDGSIGFKPVKHLQLGGSGGYLWVNVGPGTSERFPSADQIFPPSVAPGIDRQTNFARFGPYAQVDYLDNPAMPGNGGLYSFQYIWYRDQELGLHDFQRMDAEVQQYFGFYNSTRVLALRARTTLTDVARGHVLPFYMQPTVGGSEDLRGYRPFRFSDNNSLVLNGEYRWHVMSLFDMAVFADAGKVFPRRGQLNFSNLEYDGGVGFRFNIKGQPFLRLDIAAGGEGLRVWLKFNDIFGRQLFGASAQPIR